MNIFSFHWSLCYGGFTEFTCLKRRVIQFTVNSIIIEKRNLVVDNGAASSGINKFGRQFSLANHESLPALTDLEVQVVVDRQLSLPFCISTTMCINLLLYSENLSAGPTHHSSQSNLNSSCKILKNKLVSYNLCMCKWLFHNKNITAKRFWFQKSGRLIEAVLNVQWHISL